MSVYFDFTRLDMGVVREQRHIGKLKSASINTTCKPKIPDCKPRLFVDRGIVEKESCCRIGLMHIYYRKVKLSNVQIIEIHAIDQSIFRTDDFICYSRIQEVQICERNLPWI